MTCVCSEPHSHLYLGVNRSVSELTCAVPFIRVQSEAAVALAAEAADGVPAAAIGAQAVNHFTLVYI